jgi:hypothetical protein
LLVTTASDDFAESGGSALIPRTPLAFGSLRAAWVPLARHSAACWSPRTPLAFGSLRAASR